MSSEDRLRNLYIDGEPVIGLDFGQCVVRIAYGHRGLQPPAGDLYSLPRLERYREGVKKVFNAMLFSDKPLARKPQGTAKLLPKNYTIQEIQDLVRERHSAIADLFHSGFGMATQFIESRILIRCLLDLIEHGVTALPVHDCLVVPRSQADVAEGVMRRNFQTIAGIDAVVDRKALNVHASAQTRREEDF